MGATNRNYIPAAGYDWLLPFYDPFQRWLRGEKVLRVLLDGADISAEE